MLSSFAIWGFVDQEPICWTRAYFHTIFSVLHDTDFSWTTHCFPVPLSILYEPSQKRNLCCSKHCVWALEVMQQIIFSYMKYGKHFWVFSLAQHHSFSCGLQERKAQYEKKINKQFLLQPPIHAHVILIQSQLIHLTVVMVFWELMYNWITEIKNPM